MLTDSYVGLWWFHSTRRVRVGSDPHVVIPGSRQKGQQLPGTCEKPRQTTEARLNSVYFMSTHSPLAKESHMINPEAKDKQIELLCDESDRGRVV